MDATREQAIEWCRSVGADFKVANHQPPEGWMWAQDGDALVLTALFTNTEDADITLFDVKA